MFTAWSGYARGGILIISFVDAAMVVDVAHYHFYYKFPIEIPPLVDDQGAFNVRKGSTKPING